MNFREDWVRSIVLVLLMARHLPGQSTPQIPDYMYPVINDAGRMSIAAYGNDKQLVETLRQEGWGTPLQVDFPSGLHVGVWQRNLPDGNTERIVAFVGTKDLAGVAADLSQGLVGPAMTAQYRDGLDFALKQVAEKDQNPRLTVIFTGHSLGGGIAEQVNLETGVRAVVFNAAPLNGIDSLRRADQASVATTDLWNLRTKGDIVSALPLANQYGRQFSFDAVRPTSGQWTGDYSTHSVQALLDSIDATRTASSSRADLSGLANNLKMAGNLVGAMKNIMPDNKLSTRLSFGLDAGSQGLSLLGAGLSGDAQNLREQSVSTGMWGLGQAASTLAKASYPIGSDFHVGQSFASNLSLLDPIQGLLSATTSQIGDRRWLPNQTEQSQYLGAAHGLLIADFNFQFPRAEDFLKLSAAAKQGWAAGLGVTAALPDMANFAAARFQAGWASPVTANQSISFFDSVAKGTAYSAALLATGSTNMASGWSTLAGLAADRGREWTMPLFQFGVGAQARSQMADQWSQAVSRGQTSSTFSTWMGGRATALSAGFSPSEMDSYDALVRSPRNPDPFLGAPVIQSRFAFTSASGQLISGTSSFSRVSTFSPNDPFATSESTRLSTSYNVSFNGALVNRDIQRLGESTIQPDVAVRATPPAPVLFDQDSLKRPPSVFIPPSPPRPQLDSLTNILRDGGLSQQFGPLRPTLPMPTAPKLGGIDMAVELKEVDDQDIFGQSAAAPPSSPNNATPLKPKK